MDPELPSAAEALKSSTEAHFLLKRAGPVILSPAQIHRLQSRYNDAALYADQQHLHIRHDHQRDSRIPNGVVRAIVASARAHQAHIMLRRAIDPVFITRSIDALSLLALVKDDQTLYVSDLEFIISKVFYGSRLAKIKNEIGGYGVAAIDWHTARIVHAAQQSLGFKLVLTTPSWLTENTRFAFEEEEVIR